MSRVLAVDFGERRIGLATSDASGELATPRRTLRRRDDERAVEELARFCGEEEIGLVVFGIPRSPDGRESPFGSRIRSFASKLASRTRLPVTFHEETLTSHEASRRLPRGAPREAVDQLAAAVILQDYLEHWKGKGRA